MSARNGPEISIRKGVVDIYYKCWLRGIEREMAACCEGNFITAGKGRERRRCRGTANTSSPDIRILIVILGLPRVVSGLEKVILLPSSRSHVSNEKKRDERRKGNGTCLNNERNWDPGQGLTRLRSALNLKMISSKDLHSVLPILARHQDDGGEGKR